jgi:hypothetical protein
MKASTAKLLVMLLILPLINACGGGKELATTEVTTDAIYDEVIYNFHGAAVAPQYHRSYQIKVTPTHITKLVTSYSETISTTQNKIPAGAYDEVIAVFKAAGIKNCTIDIASIGCTGGTGESISCMKNEVEKFNGSLDHCGGNDSGNICGDLPTLLEKLNSLLQ